MKQYLIGIDGGASRSRAVLTDLKGAMVASAEGLSLNPLSIGWEAFQVHFKQLIAGLSITESGEVKALCAGLAGSGREEVRLRAEKEIAALLKAERVFVISDALAALWGAFHEGAGLLLIAGTGSICLGRDEDGNTARSGGFGRLLGDEGGGYWIAMEAIKAVLRSTDGRGSAGSLIQAVKEMFDLDDVRDAIPLVYNGTFSPEKIAAFAEKVLPLSKTDPAAARIAKNAGRCLAELIIATAEKLELENPKVALWGGLWRLAGEELQEALGDALKKFAFDCEICLPAESPEWGAIRYLKHKLA